MGNHLRRRYGLYAVLMLTFLACSNSTCLADQESSADKTVLKEQAESAKALIAEKQVEIEKDTERAEIAKQEKSAIKEEVELKEKEAQLVEKEAAYLKKVAEKTNDIGIKQKAKAAESQSRVVADEAFAAKEKFKIAESKAWVAQEKISKDQKEIAALKKELNDMKLEAAGFGPIVKWMNWPIFYIGEAPVTMGGVGSALSLMLLALFASAIIQRIIIGRLSKTLRLKSGAVYAISRVVHYLILIAAGVLAAQCIGLNLGSFAVVFGFLSVGIGFGLQNITSNFISGLILLFERPIAVGDFVTVDEKRGTVKQINMRSSLIETLDNVRIIVPNSKFIEGNVTNWTHGSTHVRIHCPVGVAYGSDVKKVKEVLLNVAKEHKEVLSNPSSAVRFLGFGDSSLDFELLIWINEPENQFAIHSDVNYGIDQAFREAGVQIPFPQRDLHIRSSRVDFVRKEN